MKLIIHVLEDDDSKEQIISIPDLSKKVDSLAISMRASNCLKSAGIKTVGDLTKLKPYQLSHIPNLGKETRYDIISTLYMSGYYYMGNLND
jgi:DNA-directed RNA polymerase subunit alpha